MSKQSPYSPYENLIFRETFNDLSSVLRNNGEPTNVTFENGKAVLDGQGRVVLDKPFNGIYSIRLRFSDYTQNTSVKIFADFRTDSGIGLIYDTGSGGVYTSSGTVYINGDATTTLPTSLSKEIVISGISLDAVKLFLFKNIYNTSGYVGKCDLIEIYKGTLSAEQVSNLYTNKWNIEPEFANTLLDFNSIRGIAEDHAGNTLTPSNITFPKIGTYRSAEWDGSDSMIDCGTDLIGTKSVTVMGWFYFNSNGESNLGKLLNNGKFDITRYYTNSNLLITRDGVGLIASGVNSCSLNEWVFIGITSGVLTNIYIGDIDTTITLSGSADQDAGTPTAGTTNLIIGNNSGGSRTFDGLMPILKIVEGILSLEQIEQFRSSTIKYIKG